MIRCMEKTEMLPKRLEYDKKNRSLNKFDVKLDKI